MNFRIRFRDGLACDLTQIARHEVVEREYLFYSEQELNAPLMRAPFEAVTHVQCLGEIVQTAVEDTEAKERTIEAAIPSEEVRRNILEEGKRNAGRFIFRDDGGLWVYDTEKDWFLKMEGTAERINELMALANRAQTEEKLGAYLSESEKTATVKLVIRDIDQKPMMAIAKEAWDQLLLRGDYKPFIAPVVQDAKGAYFHFDVSPDQKQVLLTRSSFTVVGGQINPVPMNIPAPA